MRRVVVVVLVETLTTADGGQTPGVKDTTGPDAVRVHCGKCRLQCNYQGDRVHKGLDIVCSDGSTVYAPFDVTLHGNVIVYTDPTKAAINDGINLRGEGLCFKLFYVRPDKTSGSVKKGHRIGTMLPMQSVYAGITSHVHVQMCNKGDPTQYF